MNNTGLTHITIQNKQVGVLFGLPAIAQIAEKEKNESFFQETIIDEKPAKTYSLFGLTDIIHAGYLNWCGAYGKFVDVDRIEFYNLIESAMMEGKTSEVIIPIVECYHNSKHVAPVFEKAITDHAKKKSLAGTKSKHSATVS